MKFKQFKVQIISESGFYGFDYKFEDGLNIIRGDNSSGKSTLINSLIYSLGMEEIIGSKGPSTLPYALRTHFDIDGNRLNILESVTYIELENEDGEIKTFKRYITSKEKDTKLVEIIHGPYLSSNKDISFDTSFTFLHDPHSSIDQEFGFFGFFEKFLGLELPVVSDNKGNTRKLYLQYIFASLLIEQKRGWTNYIANTPFYGISDATTKTVSYLLNLDTFRNEKRRNELVSERNRISSLWSEKCSNIKLIASNSGLSVKGLSIKPELDFQDKLVTVGEDKDDEKGFLSILDLLSSYVEYLEDLNNKQSVNIHDEDGGLIFRIEMVQNAIDELLVLKKISSDEIRINESKIKLYNETVNEISSDLKKNKLIKKLNNYGAENKLAIAENKCGTCLRRVEDSLVSSDDLLMPMSIDENIKYLDNQKQMMDGLLNGLLKNIEKDTNILDKVNHELSLKMKELSSCKREIRSLTNTNESDVRKKLIIEGKIESLQNIGEKVDNIIDELSSLSNDFRLNKIELHDLNKYEISFLDRNKITRFEQSFRQLASDFSYRSANTEEIEIKTNTLIPYLKDLELREVNLSEKEKAEIFRNSQQADIKSDSSASDFVRLIWAYLISIYEVSSQNNGHHLGFLVFDEPGQHSMGLESVNQMLKTLASKVNMQSIVAASFEQSDKAFAESTAGVTYNSIRLPRKLIRKLDD